jgi:hypothetical protein
VIFVPIPRERIPEEWPRILELIGPAIAHDKNASPDEVRDWLISGHSEAFWIGVPTHAAGIGVTTTRDGACFINYVAGSIIGGPRRFIRTARAIVAEIETLARQAGCTELRGGGRNWSRVFPEWEHYDPEYPNRMRKRLDG